MHWPFFLLLVLVSSVAFAQDVVDDLQKGSISWSKGVVTAKGSGTPSPGISNPAQARLLAERAAISYARRNLLETVKIQSLLRLLSLAFFV